MSTRKSITTLIAIVLSVGGCWSHAQYRVAATRASIPQPVIEASLGPAGAGDSDADTIINTPYPRLAAACQKEMDRLQAKIDDANDYPLKFKTIVGSITGAMGILGGGGTAVSAGTESVTKDDAGNTSVDGKGRTVGIGGATATVTLIGTLVTAFVTPGPATLKTEQDDKAAIQKGLDDFTQKCSLINKDNKVQCATLIGQLQGKCKFQ